MALINCPECGHQISDTAKRCPNCGYPFSKFQFGFIKPYVPGGIICLVGLLVTILSFPIMSGWGGSSDHISATFYTGCLMFLCGLGATFIGCKKLRKQFQRSMLLFWGLAVLFTVSLGIFFLNIVFDHRSNKYSDSQIEQIASDNSGPDSPVGEYEFKDSNNNSWTLILNENKIVRLHIKKGREFYGIWKGWADEIWIDFPPKEAPLGLNINGNESRKTRLIMKDEYLYFDVTASKSNNPRMRLSIAKTS